MTKQKEYFNELYKKVKDYDFSLYYEIVHSCDAISIQNNLSTEIAASFEKNTMYLIAKAKGLIT